MSQEIGCCNRNESAEQIWSNGKCLNRGHVQVYDEETDGYVKDFPRNFMSMDEDTPLPVDGYQA